MSRKTTVDFNHMDTPKPIAESNDQSHRLLCQTSFILGADQNLGAAVDKDEDFQIDEFLSNPIQVRIWVLDYSFEKWLGASQACLTYYNSVSWL